MPARPTTPVAVGIVWLERSHLKLVMSVHTAHSIHMVAEQSLYLSLCTHRQRRQGCWHGWDAGFHTFHLNFILYWPTSFMQASCKTSEERGYIHISSTLAQTTSHSLTPLPWRLRMRDRIWCHKTMARENNRKTFVPDNSLFSVCSSVFLQPVK